MAPEDRQWFEQRFGLLDQRFSQWDTRIMALELRFDLLEQKLSEKIEATETKLLTAFYKWASVTDSKLRTIPEVELRLQLLEERVRDLEFGRKPPQ